MVHRSTRDPWLGRLVWAAVIIPIVGIWLAEVLRVVVIDRLAEDEVAHLVFALGLSGAVALFGLLMVTLIRRTHKTIVKQNRDLGAIFTISPADWAGSDAEGTLRGALQRLLPETGALAGQAYLEGGDLAPLVVRHPPELPAGLMWLSSLLDERPPVPARPRLSRHKAVDAAILDIPLLGGGSTLGLIRLAFHPMVEQRISDEALADIGSAIGAAVYIAHLLTDLQRREREQAALYHVSVGLTGRVELADVLTTVTGHARTLLNADRAVACLVDARQHGPHVERLALADDGSACMVTHRSQGGRHEQNPRCRLQLHAPAAFEARPLRGPDSILGELCVARHGAPFDDREKELLGALADLTAVAVRTAQLWESEQQMTILSERDRIAREMHDSLAQVLGVIHLRLREISAAPAISEVHMRTQLDELADVADEAYRDVREAILGLRETISADKGLESTLRDYLGKYSRQTGVAARLAWGLSSSQALAPRSEVQLLRVVQEALTNVRKHADASSVIVHLEDDGHGPVLTVEDDGSGFDPKNLAQSMSGGFGIASMRERVEQVGGQLEIDSAKGNGTRIIVRLQSGDQRVTPPPTLSPPVGR